ALLHLRQRRVLVDREAAEAAVSAGAALAPGAFAHQHPVVRLDPAGGHLGGDHVGSHHLGDAGRLDPLVDVLARQHLAGGVVHHQPGGGLRRARGGRDGDGRGGRRSRLRGGRGSLGEGQAEREGGRRGNDGERTGGTELHGNGNSCGNRHGGRA